MLLCANNGSNIKSVFTFHVNSDQPLMRKSVVNLKAYASSIISARFVHSARDERVQHVVLAVAVGD